MIRYLSLEQMLDLHRLIIANFGGRNGLRDATALDSAIAQPAMRLGPRDLYPSLSAKAAALAHSLMRNKPFYDGNERIAHAAMEVFLVTNGHELSAPVADQERIFKALAAGDVERHEMLEWIESHLVPWRER